MFKLTFITVILALMAVATLAAPYQELIPKPGYVAVYIREGDTALSEIHPKLAEAFKEDKLAKIQSEDQTSEIVPVVKQDIEDVKERADEHEKPIMTDEVEEVTASDIAEFDDVKSNYGENEPEKIEMHSEGQKQ